MTKVSAVIVAAGGGSRFGSLKQFSPLCGKTVLGWTLERFEAHDEVTDIILVLPEGMPAEDLVRGYKKLTAVVTGGRKRQDSVFNGFRRVLPGETGVVLVHDGVRPLVGRDLISRVVAETRKRGAVIPVLPVEDTLKEVSGREVQGTVERACLFRAQTPQGFLYPLLREALEKAAEDGFFGTDEAGLVERTGRSVFIVPGDPLNIKITTPGDLKLAEAVLGI